MEDLDNYLFIVTTKQPKTEQKKKANSLKILKFTWLRRQSGEAENLVRVDNFNDYLFTVTIE